MPLKVVIFEDDQDIIEMFKELLEDADYKVYSCTDINDPKWQDADVVLGDYRNTVVKFNEVKKACSKLHIPLIAISGGSMDFEPQLNKPFHFEDLQSAIFSVTKNRSKRQSSLGHEEESSGFFRDVIGFIKNK
ncbi:MAG: hypothetical protein FMNOHCHN_03628 [Ignavibacteriaceae bacterium]|nr:hypothetical protein [Ignavibacteriaceae bacterium]GIL17918.1 MAG: hypothetical protein BroJett040_16690 [Oligoflexia bacterium]